MKLISAAELASSVENPRARPFVWRQNILRPAASSRQAKSFVDCEKAAEGFASVTSAKTLDADQANQMIPGVASGQLLRDEAAAALLIQGGLVLDPHRYLRALWAACKHISKDAGGEGRSRLMRERVSSLKDLEASHGPYDAIVVAAGAANGVIPEVGEKLGCELSQGYTLRFIPPSLESTKPGGARQLPGSSRGPSKKFPNVPADFGSHSHAAGDPNVSVGVASFPAEYAAQQPSGNPGLAAPDSATELSAQHQQGSREKGGEAPVLGENPDFDSCLKPGSSEVRRGQQLQIRKALGLLIDRNENADIADLKEPLDSVYDSGTDSEREDVEAPNGYPVGAPSLLSGKYLAAQGRRRIVLGATKRFGLTPEEAFLECGRAVEERGEVARAVEALKPEGEKLWPPLKDWRVEKVRSGVRALPPRTHQGAMPLAGRLPEGSRWWVLGGLGARGLVYHAWLGELLAHAVLNDTEDALPEELLRWKQPLPNSL